MTYADDDAFVSGAVNAFRSFQDIFQHCSGEDRICSWQCWGFRGN